MCPIRNWHPLEFLQMVWWESVPRALSPILENFLPALSPDPTDWCPWVSEDGPRLETSLFYVIWETCTEDIRKFSDVSVILELPGPKKPQNLGVKKQGFLVPRSSKSTLAERKGKEKKKVRGERKEEKRKKPVVALSVFTMATLESFLAEKKCLTEKVHLAVNGVFKKPARRFWEIDKWAISMTNGPASVVCHFKMAHFDRLAEFFGNSRFCMDDE